MISRIVIKGFQRHRLLRIKLDPHVTAVVGPSDEGKSTILRALRWVLLNEAPKGRMIHWDCDAASVTVYIDKHKVKRSRSKKGNFYYLDGKRFSAVGKTVPPEIAAVLDVSPINFQAQIDRHFWFHDTPGEVSRQLNAIVDLGVIDTTLGRLAANLRNTKTEVSVVEKRIESARQKCGEHKPAIEADRDLLQIELLEERIGAHVLSIDSLQHLLEEADRYKGVSAMASLLESAETEMRDLQDARTALDKVRKKLQALSSLVKRYEDQSYELGDLHAEYGSIMEQLDGAIGEECPLCGRSGD